LCLVASHQTRLFVSLSFLLKKNTPNTMKNCVIIVACVLSLASHSNAMTIEELSSSKSSLEALEHVFARSEEMRASSMASIMRTMTHAKAMHFLKQHQLSTPALVQAASLAKKSGVRSAPAGYAALDGAKTLLNDMIFNSSMKYDVEIAACTEFYATQCASMEECRGTISVCNKEGANSRALILYSQACIEKAETDILNGKQHLQFHLLQCQHELYKMRSRLKILKGDLDVLTSILKMTDCDASLVQTNDLELLRCEDPCSNKTFFTFNHDILRNKMNALQSAESRDLVHESLTTLFNGIEGLKLLQSEEDYSPAVNKTRWNNKPVPRTELPADPCTDPDAGAPSLKDKNAAKCTITRSPQCYKLQERFLLIQSGVQDEYDELSDEIDMMENYCAETKKTIQKQIANEQSLLKDCQTKLAEATEKEATSAEEGRTTAAEHDQLDEQLTHKMKSCSTNYINFETEICALKKIRGELYKMKGDANSAGFFQDCVVSKWTPGECLGIEGGKVDCGGGTMTVTRTVMVHTNGGAGCLPLDMEKVCNPQPCPVDCVLEAWNGWSKCSAECGGGVQQRLREVKVGMRYDGKPCSATSETKSCNDQACEKDCDLGDWTAWTTCSKDCDGGTQKRQKFVKNPALGTGKCADEWSMERLEYKACNDKRCPLAVGSKVLSCKNPMDIVLLIDGSGSLGRTGWNAELKAANSFVDAFIEGGADAEIAVILFSGPRTWGGVYKCIGRSSSSVDLENVCKIKTVTHFNTDLQAVKTKLSQMEWPSGSTLTSVALLSAKSELSMGRKDSKANIIVFTDGRPLSYRKTELAAREVRKAARLIWVPVTRYAPLKYIKKWATRRWEENVVVVKTFGDLEKPDVVTHIVANICPAEEPKVMFIPGTQQTYR